MNETCKAKIACDAPTIPTDANIIDQYISPPPSKPTPVFGIPEKSIELLAKIIKKQLLLLQKHQNDQAFAIPIDEYVTILRNIANLGLLAITHIQNNNVTLFAYYCKSMDESLLKHEDFISKLNPESIEAISANIPKMINIALIAFNLTNCPKQSAAFKENMLSLGNSFEALNPETSVKLAQTLLTRLFY
jgi:hypothetical protein